MAPAKRPGANGAVEREIILLEDVEVLIRHRKTDEARKPTLRHRLKEYGFFLRGFLREPRAVGSLVPSSQRLAAAMTHELQKLQPGDWVLEVGPGTGSFTRRILSEIPDSARYLGIDLNPQFVEHLRELYPSATFVQDTVENAAKHLPDGTRARVIVCSLPWTLMSSEQQDRILEVLHDTLLPGGTLSLFIYCHMLLSPPGRELCERAARRFHGTYSRQPVLANLPPATVLTYVRDA